MERFCFPIVVNTKKSKTEDYETKDFEVDGETITMIDIKALQDLKYSQKLINLSVIDTDKLVSLISDLYITWPVILGSLLWTFVIAMLYLFLVRFCAGFIVYLTTILVLGCFIVLGYFFHDRANLYDAVNDTVYHNTNRS